MTKTLENIRENLREKFKFEVFIIKLLLLVVVCISPTIAYAEDKESKFNDTHNAPGFMRGFLRLNESISKGLNRAAESLDKNISKDSPGEVEQNETFMYVLLGEDFNDHGDMTTNFRYGGQLRLPRFEKYWKLKFENQDEKRVRGQGTMTRRQRTRNTNDDLFLGVSFSKRWSDVDFTYKPQIAYSNGFGLDHSIEAERDYEYGLFNFATGLEFFANHGEGTGTSAEIKFNLWLYKKYVALEQGNAGRFVFLANTLAENHYVGFRYVPRDRLSFTIHHFRSFRNASNGYELSAYGGYIITNYDIYKNILALELKPYVVHERDDNFLHTVGIVVNFKVIF